MTRRYALVDRDGTIIEERHHLATADEVSAVIDAWRLAGVR